MGRLSKYGRRSQGDSGAEDIELIDFVATQTGVRIAVIDVHSMDCTIFGGMQSFKTYIPVETVIKSPKWSFSRKQIPYIILKQKGIEWTANAFNATGRKTPTQYYHVTNDQLLNLGHLKKYSDILYFLNKMQFIRCQTLEMNGFEIGDWKNDFEWTFDQFESESKRIQRLLTDNIS